MSGGGKYFSSFKIGKRKKCRVTGPISSILIVDSNEEIIINGLMGIKIEQRSQDLSPLMSQKSSMFFLCV